MYFFKQAIRQSRFVPDEQLTQSLEVKWAKAQARMPRTYWHLMGKPRSETMKSSN